MRFSPTPALRKITLEINSPIKVQASIRIDINIQSLEISRGVDQPNIPSLDEVISDNDVFLIWCYFDIVRSDGWLNGIGVVESFDVVEIGDVERGDVVCGCEGEVGEFSVLGEVGAVGMLVWFMEMGRREKY